MSQFNISKNDLGQGRANRGAFFARGQLMGHLLLLFTAMLTVFSVSWIQYDTLASTYYHTMALPQLRALTCLLVFVGAEFFYFLTRRIWCGVVSVYPVWVLASAVSHIKSAMRDTPLVREDLMLFKEAAKIADTVEITITPAMWGAVGIGIALVWLAKRFPPVRISTARRLVTAACGVMAAVGVFFTVILAENAIAHRYYRSSEINLNWEYDQNGFIIAFLNNLKDETIQPPEGYGPEGAARAAQSLGYRDGQAKALPDVLPNIIVIMNESLWDPRFFEDAELSGDPLSSIRQIGGLPTAGLGYTLSPSFAGSTANVEYEFLTGKSLYFYPKEAQVYQNHLSGETWSLAWHLKELGYETRAIHPFLDWYWKRNQLYPLMGFDEMVFEDTMEHTRVKGQYIGDDQVGLEIVERVRRGGDVPQFVFAVTMQNHAGYDVNYYKDPAGYRVKTRSFGTASENAALQNYVEGTCGADELYAYLVSQFENDPRPTYILMFGDHAPYLAREDFAVNLDGEGMGQPQILRSQMCPVILWSNTGREIDDLGVIGVPYLAGELLTAAELPLSPYMQMLSGLKERMRGFTQMFVLNERGAPVDSLTPQMKEDLHALSLLQYDACFGEGYVVREKPEHEGWLETLVGS